MGSVTAMRQPSSDSPPSLNEMSAELQAILARVKTVEQQASALAQQISIHEQRSGFLKAALKESHDVAAEISSSAEQRVNSVDTRTHTVVGPQRLQITELEAEIARLEQEMATRLPAGAKTGIPEELRLPPPSSPADNVVDLTAYLEHSSHAGMSGDADASLGSTGSDLLEAPDMAGAAGRVAEEVPPAEDPSVAMQACGSGTEVAEAIPPANDPSGAPTLAEGEAVPALAGESGGASHNIPDIAGQAEPSRYSHDKTEIMDFDIGINIFHTHTGEGWNRPKHRHEWKLQVRIEVPEENVDVVYIHVLATITATLSRFDNVLLNRVFPFDVIPPSHENVAGYFFNCLEDILALKELIMRELVVFEHDTLITAIDGRNQDLDEKLKGEDIIHNMRVNLLDKSKNGGVAADRPPRKRFEFFKKP